MPQISVIVPVYKVEPYLRRCVDSILAQTFTDFELILVDDGSPDNCPAICDEYAAQDARVHVIHQQNGGLSAARNAGLDWVFQNSDSAWISFVDSDDWVHYQYFEILLAAAQINDDSIVVCQHKPSTEFKTEQSIDNPKYEMMDIEQLFCQRYGDFVSACVKLFGRKCWEECRFPAGKMAEDVYTIPQILFEQSRICVVNEELYYYYRNEQSIMHSQWNVQKLTMLEAHQKQVKWLKEKGYKKALRREYRSYAMNLSMQISGMQEQGYNPVEIRELRRILRKILFLKTPMDIPISKKNLWIYESAYPKAIQLFWYMIVLKNKILKK